jgi:hypothetical protein
MPRIAELVSGQPMINHTDAKDAAGRIVARLRSLNVNVKSSHGYQAVAAYHNFPDWNHMTASMGSRQTVKIATQDTSTPLPDPARGTATISSEGPLLRARRDAPQYHVVSAPPGYGKTTMLWLRTLVELEDPEATFLHIAIGGCDEMPASLRSMAYRVSVASHPGKAPHVTVDAPAQKEPRGCLVLIHRPLGIDPSAQESSAALGDALTRLPHLLTGVLPPTFLEKISLIAVDETSQLWHYETERSFFVDTLPLWLSGGADIVLAHQFPKILSDHFTLLPVRPNVIAPPTRTAPADPDQLGTRPVRFAHRRDAMLEVAAAITRTIQGKSNQAYTETPRAVRLLAQIDAMSAGMRRRIVQVPPSTAIEPSSILKGFALRDSVQG